MVTEYFTKWVKAIPFCKDTGGAVANFIKENIIVRFIVAHKIISDNGMPFVNSEVRKMLEFYQIKHQPVVTLLPPAARAGKGNKQDSHQDHWQDESRICWGMGNASARHPLGLLKLTKVCHGVFPIFLSLWNGSDEPN